jgi:hypothetical protein
MKSMLDKQNNINVRKSPLNNRVGKPATGYWISSDDFVELFFSSKCKVSKFLVRFIRELIRSQKPPTKEGDPGPEKNFPTAKKETSARKRKSSFPAKAKKLRFKRKRDAAKNSELERDVARRLAADLNGTLEVSVPFGRVDIVTSNTVIEVKKANMWRSAMGQVLDYGRHFPDKSMRIHLFGPKDLLDSMLLEKREIESCCTKYNIEVTYEVCSAIMLI